MRRKKVKQHSCANCGFEFSANSEHINYCPNCGQENHNPRFPLFHYVYEIIESLIHVDTKFFYSVKILLFRPGKITYDYIHNIRGRYTPPARLFIFLSVIFLIIANFFEKRLANWGYFGTNSQTAIEKNMTVGKIFDISEDSIKDNILVPPFSWFMKNPSVTNKDLRILKKYPADSVGVWLTHYGYADNSLTRFYALNKKLRISRNMTVPEATIMVSSILKWLYLILIPVNAFILLIFFYHKGLLFYDTLLFSIHFTSLIMIILSITLLQILWLAGLSKSLLLILLFINLIFLFCSLFISLKKVFSFGWFGTILRMIFAVLIAFACHQLIHYFISSISGK